jgi:hypothetical protein
MVASRCRVVAVLVVLVAILLASSVGVESVDRLILGQA